MLKDIIDSFNSTFSAIEADAGTHTLRKVAIMGTPISKNGYSYSTQAMDSLAAKSNGTKVFLNHPAKDEAKKRDGVRDLRDFVGVFRNARRDGTKVTGDLVVREAYWPLLRDIASMAPQGIGMSLNAQVTMTKGQDGKESVGDISLLRSIDLVASAATCDNLFEQHKTVFESIQKDTLEQAGEKFMSILEGRRIMTPAEKQANDAVVDKFLKKLKR